MFSDDITFCANFDCPLRNQCWRAHKPRIEYVCVSNFEWKKRGKVYVCEHFWEYPKGVKKEIWVKKQ